MYLCVSQDLEYSAQVVIYNYLGVLHSYCICNVKLNIKTATSIFVKNSSKESHVGLEQHGGDYYPFK